MSRLNEMYDLLELVKRPPIWFGDKVRIGGKKYTVDRVTEVKKGTAMARTIDRDSGEQRYTHWVQLKTPRGKSVDAYLERGGKTIAISSKGRLIGGQPVAKI